MCCHMGTEYGFLRHIIESTIGLCFISTAASRSEKGGNFVDQLNYSYFSIFCYFLFGITGGKTHARTFRADWKCQSQIQISTRS
jgi:hypothetical protein